MPHFLIAGFLSLSLLGALAGPSEAADTWRTYVEQHFGSRLAYPPSLFPDIQVGQDGARLLGPDAAIEVSGRIVPGVRSPWQLRTLMAKTIGYDKVTYSASGRNWLVVSGYRGRDIFYEKFYLSGRTVQGFSIQYPVEKRQLYDDVVEYIEDSFHPGRASFRPTRYK